MPIKVVCPYDGCPMNVPETCIGLTILHPGCGERFEVPLSRATTPEDKRAAITRSWLHLMDACIANADGRLETLAQLIKAYAEPHRHYHNLQHIVSMLDVLPLRGLGSKQPETLKLAAWYHDVVYDPRSAENESRSASVARASLSALGIRNDRIERTCALILMTKDHKADDGDPDAELFLDADLSILRSPSHAYDAYARAIREEYAWVPDRDYCDGRIKVLRGFLQRPKVFRSARTMEAHESQARINITTEIARLERKLEMSAP